MNDDSEGLRRVVISGVGAVCPLGLTGEAIWDALRNGRSGVAERARLPGGLPMAFAGECREFTGAIDDFGVLSKDAKRAIRKGVKLMCRETQMGVASAMRAMDDAKLETGAFDPERTGICFGSDYMLTEPDEFLEGIRVCTEDRDAFDFARWGTEGLEKLSPLWLLKYLPNMPACHVAIYNDFRGPNNSITHREASNHLAIVEAAGIIRRGSADVMLAGATGTRIHPMKAVHCAQQEQVIANGFPPEKASRPFDRDRRGMVLGEGAGTVVLEELRHAQSRGAPIYGEVLGGAGSMVAGRNLVARRDEALANVMRLSLTRAGTAPSELGHLHAHGLSTTLGDLEEWRAISEVFGDVAERIPVVAAKSYFGNLGAGSGAIELITSLLALRNDALFPMLNYETRDPECPVAAVVSQDAEPGRSFLSCSVTPQGQASAVLIGRYAD